MQIRLCDLVCVFAHSDYLSIASKGIYGFVFMFCLHRKIAKLANVRFAHVLHHRHNATIADEYLCMRYASSNRCRENIQQIHLCMNFVKNNWPVKWLINYCSNFNLMSVKFHLLNSPIVRHECNRHRMIGYNRKIEACCLHNLLSIIALGGFVCFTN